jgi:nitrogen fixation-related uncharacterized protein
MNYAVSWLGLVTISLAISLAAFVWALNHGQFNEQQRLRYLPLRDETARPDLGNTRKTPLEVKALAIIGLLVFCVYLAAVVIAIWEYI